MIRKRSLGHLCVSSGTLPEIVRHVVAGVSRDERSSCIPINVTKYGLSKRDQKLRNAINNARFVIADGMPITWLARRHGYRDVHRVTGIDLAEAMLAEAATHGWKVFLLGASQVSLDRTAAILEQRFNNLHIAGKRNGFFRPADVPKVIDQINEVCPHLLLLGLGLPQKEYFVVDHLEKLNVHFCVTVGGAFDVWAGMKRRTPCAIQSVGLEWLYRSIYDRSKTLNLIRQGSVFARDLLFTGEVRGPVTQ